ncbi:MAG: hypothetical protein E6G22_13135 [Actinobacteria bacterium]|nr:MAG: hypothetical protein E6G22_13135 [Actinomycetota bacterium]
MAELSGEGFDAEAFRGGKGQFDVNADGRLVFSKAETHRFPEAGEVLAALRASA